jgi:diguanylate cyclase (GGDEF)-like protein/PAS domain S-box-containing protein
LLLFCYVTLILRYFPFPFVYLGLGLALLALRNGVFGAAVAGFLVSFCIAVFIRIGWFTWPQYGNHLQMLFIYLPILITLIPPLLLAIFVDALHIREQQLFARESMFREAMAASALGMALISTDGQLLKVNRALCDMLGYTEWELTNLLWPQLLHPDDVAADANLQQLLLSNRQNSYRLEARYLCKNDKPLWVLIVVSMVRDDRGLPHYFVLQVENIDSRRHSEERERELFNRYLLAIEAGQVGVWEYQPQQQILNWDERMFDLYGLERHHIMPSFSLWKSCVHPDDLPQLMQQIDLALRETNILDSEFRVIYPDDSIHYLRTHAMVERDAEGNTSRMVGTNWDITELRALMNDLSHERELLRTTLLSIGEAVIMTDQKARIVFMNPAAERMLICTNNNVLYCSIDEVMKVVDADGNPLPNPLYAALEQRRLVYLDHDAYLQIIDGTTIAIQDSAAPILRNNNELLGGVLVFSDVTEMRSLQKRLGYQASHDPLTGLINRSAFETILQDVVKESVMTAGHSVLVFLDLDHFKQVNDTAGHAAGDELLKQLASLMNARMRASDIVARLGGDEFGLIFRNCSVEYADSLIHEVINDIDKFEFRWEGQLFHVGASAGLVPINEQFTNFNTLLACADQACYEAKRAGRGQVKRVSTSF